MTDRNSIADDGEADLVDAERFLPTALWENIRAPYDKVGGPMKNMLLDTDAVMDWLAQKDIFKIKRNTFEHKVMESVTSETKMVESKTTGLTSTVPSNPAPAQRIASGTIAWYQPNRGYNLAAVVGRNQVH